MRDFFRNLFDSFGLEELWIIKVGLNMISSCFKLAANIKILFSKEKRNNSLKKYKKNNRIGRG